MYFRTYEAQCALLNAVADANFIASTLLGREEFGIRLKAKFMVGCKL